MVSNAQNVYVHGHALAHTRHARIAQPSRTYIMHTHLYTGTQHTNTKRKKGRAPVDYMYNTPDVIFPHIHQKRVPTLALLNYATPLSPPPPPHRQSTNCIRDKRHALSHPTQQRVKFTSPCIPTVYSQAPLCVSPSRSLPPKPSSPPSSRLPSAQPHATLPRSVPFQIMKSDASNNVLS